MSRGSIPMEGLTFRPARRHRGDGERVLGSTLPDLPVAQSTQCLGRDQDPESDKADVQRGSEDLQSSCFPTRAMVNVATVREGTEREVNTHQPRPKGSGPVRR